MDKTLRKFTSHEEMRAETYRYWHGRPDSDDQRDLLLAFNEYMPESTDDPC